MMKQSTIPPYIPVTNEDVGVIKTYLKEAIMKMCATDHPSMDATPYICTFAIDWQSEDKSTVHRIARYELAYIEGEFVEGCAVPAEYQDDRTLISQLFEVVVFSNSVTRRKDWVECWKIVGYSQFLDSATPDSLNHFCDSFILQPDCGVLFLTILSNAKRHSDDCELIVIEGIQSRLKCEHEPFKGCRENSEDRDVWYEDIWHDEAINSDN